MLMLFLFSTSLNSAEVAMDQDFLVSTTSAIAVDVNVLSSDE